jgi:serine/threonine protein kinase/MFS family permease
MSLVQHENVLRLYGVSYSPPTVAVVMELAERGALFDLITSESQCESQPNLEPGHAVGAAERLLVAQRYNPPVRFTGMQRLRLVLDAVCGLDRLHKHTVPLLHRDIKSLNLMVDEGWRLKIADFGDYSFFSHEKHELSNFTPHWTAPEVLTGGVFTPSADVYSLAMVVFEIYTGRQPFMEMSKGNGVAAAVLAGNRPDLNQCVPADDGAVISAELRELVLQSWDAESTARPALADWKRVLKDSLKLERGYEGGGELVDDSTRANEEDDSTGTTSAKATPPLSPWPSGRPSSSAAANETLSLWPTERASNFSRTRSVSISRSTLRHTPTPSLAARALGVWRSTSVPVSGSPLARALVLVLTCTGGVAVYFQYSMLGATAIQLNDNFGITAARIGLLASAYSVPNTIIPLLGGTLADRLAPLTAAVIFTGITALGAALFAVCISLSESTLDSMSSTNIDGNTVRFYLLMLCQAIFGAGAESVGIMQKAVLASWFPPGRLAMAYSCILVFNNVGACMCLWVVPVISKVQQAYVVSALIAIGSFGSICLLKLLVECGCLVTPVFDDEEEEEAEEEEAEEEDNNLGDNNEGKGLVALRVELQGLKGRANATGKGALPVVSATSLRRWHSRDSGNLHSGHTPPLHEGQHAAGNSSNIQWDQRASGQREQWVSGQRGQWASKPNTHSTDPLPTLEKMRYRAGHDQGRRTSLEDEPLTADECSNRLLLALDLQPYRARGNRNSWGTEPVGMIFGRYDTSPNKTLYATSSTREFDGYASSRIRYPRVQQRGAYASTPLHMNLPPVSIQRHSGQAKAPVCGRGNERTYLPPSLPLLHPTKSMQHELMSPVEQHQLEQNQDQEQGGGVFVRPLCPSHEKTAKQAARGGKPQAAYDCYGAWFLLRAMMSPFGLLVLMLGIGSTLNNTFENFGVSILEKQWGLAYASANHYVSVLRIVAIFAMPLVGRMLDAVGMHSTHAQACLMHKRFVCLGLAMMSSTFALLAVVGGDQDEGDADGRKPSIALVPVCMLGVGSAVFFTAAWPSVCFLVDARVRASAFGVLTAAQNVASLVLSPLSGYVKDSTGSFQAMELMLAGLGVAAAVAGACLWHVRIDDGLADGLADGTDGGRHEHGDH